MFFLPHRRAHVRRIVTPEDLLGNAGHRPWPAPMRPWTMRQTWHDLLFMHWPVEVRAILPLLPAGLTIDTFEGRAWIAVVPFWMSGIQLRGFPPIPGTARFPEINVRTYVRYEDKPGVYFISLDAPRPLANCVARWWFRLNYYLARVIVERNVQGIAYESNRYGCGAEARFRAHYCPVDDARCSEPGSLVHWLTERYCLYAGDRRGRLFRAEIVHAPWTLQEASVEIIENTMTEPVGIEVTSVPPLLHFAQRMDTLIWSPDMVHRGC